MQTTTNYELKKPDYTNFSDIQDLNDNMDTIDELLASPTGDTADSTVAFTSSDVSDASATSWTSVSEMTSGETHKSIFAKISQMFKNIRFLYKLLGNTDISTIGNGTVTDILALLSASLPSDSNGFIKFKVLSGQQTVSNGTVHWEFDSPFSTSILGAVAITYGNNSATMSGVKLLSYDRASVDFLINYIDSGSAVIKTVASGTVGVYAIAYGV